MSAAATVPASSTRRDVYRLLDDALPGREGPDWCWLPGPMHVGVDVAADGTIRLTGRGLPAAAVVALLAALPPILA